jgi:hypothetical protein
MRWFEAIFLRAVFLGQIWKCNLECHLTSTTSKTGLPNILKTVLKEYIFHNDWYDVLAFEVDPNLSSRQVCVFYIQVHF